MLMPSDHSLPSEKLFTDATAKSITNDHVNRGRPVLASRTFYNAALDVFTRILIFKFGMKLPADAVADERIVSIHVHTHTPVC
jgi:hypothetical protein